MSAVLAVDTMGGDLGPRSIVPACCGALREYVDLRLVLFGDQPTLETLLAEQPDYAELAARLRLVHTTQVVSTDEAPAAVLRHKIDSSLRQSLEAVRKGEAQACVSAGNTGALLALSRYVLKTLPGIDRPAMIKAIPSQGGSTLLLDVGANVDCSAEHLYQFAIMGSVVAELRGIERPRVALLNVGTEAQKGNQLVKLTASLLQETPRVNFVGFIEGDGVYRGEADVVVCDGFAGNVLLKASEGLAQLLSQRIESIFQENLGKRLVGSFAMPLLRRLQDELAPSQHNGASFVGLPGIVVKSHGSAEEHAFLYALRRAVLEVEENLPQHLHERLGKWL